VVQVEYEHESPDEVWVWAFQSICWIALINLGIGRKEDALKGLESVLAIRKKELGKTHPKTIYALTRVNEVKSELGIL